MKLTSQEKPQSAASLFFECAVVFASALAVCAVVFNL